MISSLKLYKRKIRIEELGKKYIENEIDPILTKADDTELDSIALDVTFNVFYIDPFGYSFENARLVGLNNYTDDLELQKDVTKYILVKFEHMAYDCSYQYRLLEHLNLFRKVKQGHLVVTWK